MKFQRYMFSVLGILIMFGIYDHITTLNKLNAMNTQLQEQQQLLIKFTNNFDYKESDMHKTVCEIKVIKQEQIDE